jgi:hypothetical protein
MVFIWLGNIVIVWLLIYSAVGLAVRHATRPKRERPAGREENDLGAYYASVRARETDR